MREFIRIYVEVQGSYSANVEAMLRRQYYGRVIYKELPEDGKVTSNVRHPVIHGIPTWGYTYYVEVRR